MKYVFTIFAIVSIISITDGALFEQIEGVEGVFKKIEFDSDFNSYIVANLGDSDRLIKLNSQKQTVFNFGFNSIATILLKNNDDLFIVYSDDDEHYHLGIMRKDSINIDYLFPMQVSNISPGRSKITFLDEEDNLFMNLNDSVYVLKADVNASLEETPILVKNSEGYPIFSESLIRNDDSGNIYYGAYNVHNQDRLIFLVRKEDKHLETPIAHVLSGIVEQGEVIVDIATLSDSVFFGGLKYLKALENDKITTFINDKDSLGIGNFHFVQEKLFYTQASLQTPGGPSSENPSDYLCYIKCKFCNSTTDIVFSTLPVIYCSGNRIISDSEGNIYFTLGYDYTAESLIYVLNKDATVLEPINIPNYLYLSDAFIDENDDLWMLAGDLYYLKKGTYDAVLVPGLPYSMGNHMKFHRDINEIFINVNNEVYAFLKHNFSLPILNEKF